MSTMVSKKAQSLLLPVVRFKRVTRMDLHMMGATRCIICHSTSENLYANALGKNYLFEHTFANMTGQIRYKCSVKVTYATKWEEVQPDLTGPSGTKISQPPQPKKEKFYKTYTFELTPREYRTGK
ncbi:hypothetical protein A3848_12480 [Paenibacillus sp. P32E]|nr:DUF5704 domain-containing protein [Paenibacillus sp. P32E]OKP90169.1 hypothetical protein A3848_12480 [Paenibacillus sp. P32E]